MTCKRNNFLKLQFESARCKFEELYQSITVAEIEVVVHNLKTKNKSFASDLLINEYFIESFDTLCSHLIDVFNAVLSSGHFPEQWSQGIIVLLFKKNDPFDVNNYRCITLVSCFLIFYWGFK